MALTEKTVCTTKQGIDNVVFYTEHGGEQEQDHSEAPPSIYSESSSGRSSPTETPACFTGLRGNGYERALPLRIRSVHYLSSQKGHELVKGTSLMMAVTLVVVGLTLLLSLHLADKIVESRDITIFMLFMFSVSAATFILIVFLGCNNKLTTDDHYKDQRGTAFLRAGMTALATGGIVFYMVELIFLAADRKKCRTPLLTGKNSMAVIFIALQVAFLLRYSKIRINNSLVVVTACRFLLMFIVATNGVVWLKAIMDETVEEIHKKMMSVSSKFPNHTLPLIPSEFPEEAENETEGSDYHQCHSDLGDVIAPYLYPLLIEFSVVASTMALSIWEKCGVGMATSSSSEELDSVPPVQCRQESRVSIATSVNSLTYGDTEVTPKSGFYNSNLGFVFGWMSLVAAMVSIILVLYGIYTGYGHRDMLDSVVYGINLAISSTVSVIIPLTICKMARLSFKDEEIRYMRKGAQSTVKKPRLHKKLDQNLLTITFMALLAYKLMSMIAAYQVHKPVILLDGIISIFMGFLQTGFINWFAIHKRTKTHKERNAKPGRQFLEFLRMANLSLWLVNTFLLKQTDAKGVQVKAFGNISWVIISNILQPLTILYYFHSMVCIAEVINRSYTNKYIGIQRPSKLKSRQQSVVTIDIPERTDNEASTRHCNGYLTTNITFNTQDSSAL